MVLLHNGKLAREVSRRHGKSTRIMMRSGLLQLRRSWGTDRCHDRCPPRPSAFEIHPARIEVLLLRRHAFRTLSALLFRGVSGRSSARGHGQRLRGPRSGTPCVGRLAGNVPAAFWGHTNVLLWLRMGQSAKISDFRILARSFIMKDSQIEIPKLPNLVPASKLQAAPAHTTIARR